MAESPWVPPTQPRGPAVFRSPHSEGSPRGRGSPGRSVSAPGRLLPFQEQGQSAHERQDHGRPPKPFPRRRPAWRGGALGAWGVSLGARIALVAALEPRTPLPPPGRRKGGVGAGSREDAPRVPPLGRKDFSFLKMSFCLRPRCELCF